MQGADAAEANGVFRHVESAAKFQSPATIQYLFQRLVPDIADGLMKKTGAHRAVRIDHGGNPWGVTRQGNWFHETELLPKMTNHALQLLGCLKNKSPARPLFLDEL